MLRTYKPKHIFREPLMAALVYVEAAKELIRTHLSDNHFAVFCYPQQAE